MGYQVLSVAVLASPTLIHTPGLILFRARDQVRRSCIVWALGNVPSVVIGYSLKGSR